MVLRYIVTLLTTYYGLWRQGLASTHHFMESSGNTTIFYVLSSPTEFPQGVEVGNLCRIQFIFQ